MDMSQYRDLFVSESKGHLQVFNELAVRCEEEATPEIIAELFRHAHSLKGMAATMQYTQIAELAHRMEDLLSKVRSGEFTFSPSLVDLMLEGSDLLTTMVNIIDAGSTELPDICDIVSRLHDFTPDTPTDSSAAVHPEGISTASSENQQQGRQHQFRQTDTFKSVRVKTEVLDRLVNITGELITLRHHIADTARQSAVTALNGPLGIFSSLLRELRDEVFKARMLPFSIIAERFPRLVRDLARKQGKEILFQLAGGDIELDRGILEEIAEPLLHILRNAVDHGMEMADERVMAGKPFNGAIKITVTRDKDNVEIAISDDGRGMDAARLVEKGVEKGIITRKQADSLSPQEAFMLICVPGFSTAETVTEISGRGVGMDAVKTTVQSLGGLLTIESTPGRGSRFLLTLPITVSIIHALLLSSGEITVAFPLSTVERTLELKPDEINYSDDTASFRLNGKNVPIKELNRLLGQPLPDCRGDIIPAFLTETTGQLTALTMDRVVGQREIFVKPLGKPLSNLKGITGGSVMGDGQIIFVMDASTLAAKQAHI